MRIAILSDIHSNAEAFNAVLLDIDSLDVSTMISLGDNIGYGPDPNEVIHMLQEHHIHSVIGNHEIAILDKRFLALFNNSARVALKVTEAMLTKNSLEYLKTLQHSYVNFGFRFVHGFPPESVVIYLFQKSEPQLIKAISRLQESICFVGHTHQLGMISWDEQTIDRRRLNPSENIIEINTTQKYIINVGSVGQPRDLNNKAKYVIMDTDKNYIEARFVEYDYQTTVNKILKTGIPIQYANFLL
ncbi:MAG: metallophosphoesterase family protein [Desulfobacterales bacterium]|nr:metallophosphoesterase family protein [Desulfobacterales bacterium]